MCTIVRNVMRWAAAALMLLASSGCAGQDIQMAPTDTAPTPIIAAYRLPTTIAVCVDTSFSNDHALTLEALHWMADLLDAAVRPNAGPLTAYITLINRHTYDPGSTPVVVQIPAVAAQPPSPPLAPMPPASADPYGDALARARAARKNAQTQAAYRSMLARADVELARVRQDVRSQTSVLRRLDPPIDYQAASVYGCIDRTAERLSDASGAKILVVASDLRNDTLRDYLPPGALSLHGVQVRVEFFACAVAPSCQARQATWTHYFLAIGAASVIFHEPAISRTLPHASYFDAGSAG